MMSSWLFNVYMDLVVRKVDARLLWKVLELLPAYGGRRAGETGIRITVSPARFP